MDAHTFNKLHSQPDKNCLRFEHGPRRPELEAKVFLPHKTGHNFVANA